MAARIVKYWVQIGIACAGTGDEESRSSPLGRLRTRQSSALSYCERDLNFWLGSPSGEFSPMPRRVVRLVDPTRSDVAVALVEARRCFRRWARNSDWDGGGLAIYFMGHGTEDPFSLCLKDGDLSAEELAAWIAPLCPNPRQFLDLDLVLDSCFASGFVGSFVAANDWDRVVLDDVVAASLHNEPAWECDSVRHGLMTWSYKYQRDRGAAFLDLAHTGAEVDRARLAELLEPDPRDPVALLSDRNQNVLSIYKGGLVEVAGCGEFEMPERNFGRPGWRLAVEAALAAESGVSVPWV